MAGTNEDMEVPEHLLCPICFEVPQNKVYQCIDGHEMCETCYDQLTECPQCRKPLNITDPIRCRHFERQLDSLKADCPYKLNGCKEKIARGDVINHQKVCKFNKSSNFCQLLGYGKCEFLPLEGTGKQIVDHLVTKHGCILTSSVNLHVELISIEGEINEAINDKTEFWTPIIIDIKDKQCFLVSITLLNKKDGSFGWLSYSIPYAKGIIVPKVPELNYTLPHEQMMLTFSDRPLSCTNDSTHGSSLRLPLNINWLTEHYVKYNNLFVNVSVTVHGQNVVYKNFENIICSKSAFMYSEESSRAKWIVVDETKFSSTAENIIRQQILEFKQNRNNLRILVQKIFNGYKPPSIIHEIKCVKNGILLAAAEFASTKLFKTIIDKGMSCNVANQNRETLLHLAMRDTNPKEGLEKTKFLVDNGVNYNVLTIDYKASPLHWAAWHSNDEAVRYFLGKGLGVNSVNINLRTPLHYACNNTTLGVSIAKVLFECGADPYLKDKNGKTPLMFAKTLQFAELEKLIHDYQ